MVSQFVGSQSVFFSGLLHDISGTISSCSGIDSGTSHKAVRYYVYPIYILDSLKSEVVQEHQTISRQVQTKG